MIRKLIESIGVIATIGLLVWICQIRNEPLSVRFAHLSKPLRSQDLLKVDGLSDLKMEDTEHREPVKERLWRKPSQPYREFLQLIDNPRIFKQATERLEQILRDRTLLDMTEAILFRQPLQNKIDLLEERLRIDAVEYLAMVLANLDDDDSQRSAALGMVKKLLLKERISQAMEIDLKKSLVGDQVELGVQFAVSSPAEWLTFKEENRDDKRFLRLADFVDKRISLLESSPGFGGEV